MHYKILGVAGDSKDIEHEDHDEWIQCSSSSCQKWRRVDVETAHAYGNKQFLRDEKMKRQKNLQKDVPYFSTHVARALRRLKQQHQKNNKTACQDETNALPDVSLATFHDMCATSPSAKIKNIFPNLLVTHVQLMNSFAN